LTVGKERTEAREEAFFDGLKLAFVPERGGKTEFVEGFSFFVGDGEGKFAVRTFERPTEGDGREIGRVFELDGVKGGRKARRGSGKFPSRSSATGQRKGKQGTKPPILPRSIA
jgi:hypothetical protein